MRRAKGWMWLRMEDVDAHEQWSNSGCNSSSDDTHSHGASCNSNSSSSDSDDVSTNLHAQLCMLTLMRTLLTLR